MKVINTAAVVIMLMLATAIQAQTSDNYRSELADKTVKIDNTTLPIVFINTSGQTILRDEYILARMKIIADESGVSHGDTIAYPNQTVDYEGWVALRYRGNTSFSSSDKKPYQFRTLKTDTLPDDGGEKKKVKILGMGKDNKWAFIAPWCDRSMMRDVLSFTLAEPWMDYVPHARFCEVILDGYYYGIYVLTERVSKGKHRLDLDDPGSADGDLTGDYLVEIDRTDDYHYTSQYHPTKGIGGKERTSKYIKYQYKSPDEEDFVDLPILTRDSLQAQIDAMETSFTTDYYTDPDLGYRQYIDPVSFIDYFLATELSADIDGYRLSTPLYKYSKTRAKKEGLDHRWKLSIWDFNIAWGNANYYGAPSTTIWQYNINARNDFYNDGEQVPFYWYKLLQDTAWVNQAKARWAEYRQSNHATERILATVDSIADMLTSSGAIDRNQQAWEIIGKSGVWPCPYTGDTYEDEVDYLKTWIQDRLTFLDSNLLPPRDIATESVSILSGWNADVVAEGSPVDGLTTGALDGSFTFYSANAHSNGALPEERVINSAATKGVKYQLQPYDENNAILLSSKGSSATAVFSESVSTPYLYILATSANGNASLTVQVNYRGGTSDTQTITLYDWSRRNPDGSEAITGLGRIGQSGDFSSYSDDNHYALYDIIVPTDEDKLVRSVTFTSNNVARPTVMAISYETATTSAVTQPIAKPRTSQITGIYTLDGRKVSKPQRGVNIIRYNDGSTRKIVVK